MRRITGLTIAVSAAFLTACATGTNGPVQIGPDTYMLGGHGRYIDTSGSVVKARFFEEAGSYCLKKNRVMVPVASTGQDSGFGSYASAEVQFRCVSR